MERNHENDGQGCVPSDVFVCSTVNRIIVSRTEGIRFEANFKLYDVYTKVKNDWMSTKTNARTMQIKIYMVVKTHWFSDPPVLLLQICIKRVSDQQLWKQNITKPAKFI